MVQNARWQDRVNLWLGIWFFVSPVVLGTYAPGSIGIAVWHTFFMSVLVIAISVSALEHFHVLEEWGNLALGLWLIVAPFLLGFSHETLALWNHVIVGSLLVIDAIWVMANVSGYQLTGGRGA